MYETVYLNENKLSNGKVEKKWIKSLELKEKNN